MPTLARLQDELVRLIRTHLRISIQQSPTEHMMLYHNAFDLSSIFFKKPHKIWLSTNKTTEQFMYFPMKGNSFFVNLLPEMICGGQMFNLVNLRLTVSIAAAARRLG